MSRTLSIFGATGSIGTSTLDLVERSGDAFELVAVTASSNGAMLAEIARKHRAKRAVIADEDQYDDLKARLAGSGCEVAAGPAALVEAARMDCDLHIAAIVGCAGLEPTMAAVEQGQRIGLANKESLVTAGALMTDAARRSGAILLPVDSEHNAIFQCLAGSHSEQVAKIILTASGGPFRTASAESIARATPTEAVAHPNWTMGAKISVDSATLMNKGLELIEASYLFAMPSERIDIVVHPQSIVHSMVEYIDGSVIAQLGSPDMRIPIAYALAWPDRMETPAERLDLAAAGRLDFEKPDLARFPALRLAREALVAGGAAPVVLNAANEIAVESFLAGALRFGDIPGLAERALADADFAAPRSIGDVLEIDCATRARVGSMIEALCP
jgi:1-deoxy-D-xylulose-5-phosphate reductoisomerase